MIAHLPTGAAQGLVMLHGRGGSAGDILSLLDHAALPDVAAVAPQAPGNSWWPSSFLAPAAQMEPFVQRGLAEVAAAVARLEQAGLARGSIWLCGFSQGACLALEAFAREGQGLAGVFAFSGGLVGLADQGAPDPALYGHAGKRLDYRGQRGGRVWMSVHQRDPHIPLTRVEDSAAALRGMGAAVDMRVYPGAGHGVMRDDIAALRRYLNG
ncbi:MAG: dienelactone hydrolase family protein [Pseudotabrizicola sp.]|uniref:alpha/beta hydrolase n=1 Tax=Pseudotabrizicola sp. TaxID=2939647 RepID=UPI0027267BF0|nr:dienelactone hydrolase family protein [Pseudotabrizicola sp.]MDO9637798.1 dienelactone hydrolase family protein [Pseudotabrizicola sp.]